MGGAPTPAPQRSVAGKVLSIISMILGICGLIPFGGIASAIVGLILGIIGKKKNSEVGAPTGMATAGIIMSIIGLAFSIIFTIVCLTCASCADSISYW